MNFTHARDGQLAVRPVGEPEVILLKNDGLVMMAL